MTTLVLTYMFADAYDEQDKEFDNLNQVETWLRGQRETDFTYIELFDVSSSIDLNIVGWSAILQYISENTGEVKEPI